VLSGYSLKLTNVKVFISAIGSWEQGASNRHVQITFWVSIDTWLRLESTVRTRLIERIQFCGHIEALYGDMRWSAYIDGRLPYEYGSPSRHPALVLGAAD
jgi:hypothetical protein